MTGMSAVNHHRCPTRAFGGVAGVALRLELRVAEPADPWVDEVLAESSRASDPPPWRAGPSSQR